MKQNISEIINEVLTDESIKNDIDKLVTIGSNSLLALTFVTAIEEAYEIEIENDMINHLFFSDINYIQEVINKSKEICNNN